MKTLRRLKEKLFVVAILLSLVSCSTGDDGQDSSDLPFTNLQEYVVLHSLRDSTGIIACAASDEVDSSIVNIFFLPPDSMTNPLYFEMSDLNLDERDYTNFKPIDYTMVPVFQGFLQKFVRQNPSEGWSVVAALSPNTVNICDPIRFKNSGMATEYNNNMSIDFADSTKPKFSWDDGRIKENVIYFQAITNPSGEMVSGTYTVDKFYNYGDYSNVVLDVNKTPPPSALIPGAAYKITLMAVSEDNWVNLVIEKEFTIP